MLVSDALDPPPNSAPWSPVTLPDNWVHSRPGLAGATSWYRVAFDLPPGPAQPGSWGVYLPYFYDGAHVFLNGAPLLRIRGSDAHWRVLWVRPHLAAVPEGLARPGRNVLLVRATLPGPAATLRFPTISIGPHDELLPLYERRLFWMRTLPQVTVATCALMAVFVLFVWWRRRQETLYGLLGLAALLWRIRTLSFVIEQMPVDRWGDWRVLYWAATGGFVVVLALFALRFSGLRRPWLERGLWVYWLIGPAWTWAHGADPGFWVNRGWAAGLIPIGLLVLALVGRTAWRQRSWQAWMLLAAIAVSVAAGTHDHLVVSSNASIASLAPDWSGHRIYLLHLAANGLLLVMAAILTSRFIRSMNEVEELNQSLETRVADRERQLANQFEAMAQFERDRAAEGERQRIMLDMHDGLGSQLFTSLSRVERGAMAQHDVADVLRSCIAEMRLALDALAPSDGDFRSAFGNFRYRWEAQLTAAGLASSWAADVSDARLEVPAHHRLQLLRVLQEALTNVVKHAQARSVQVNVASDAQGLRLEVRDDGVGLPHEAPCAGRGLNNMRARALRIGAELTVVTLSPGTRVTLQLSRPAARAPPAPPAARSADGEQPAA